MTWTVRFENVSKRYRGGSERYSSLRDDLALFGRRATAFGRRSSVEAKEAPALDRVSFEVGEGETFAITGPTGAGKTTALKLLSGISSPTGRRVRIRGSVGAPFPAG